MVNIIDSNETVMYENGRESGYSEGYEDGLETKIEKLLPHPTEAITLFFNIDNTSVEQVESIVDWLRKEFPNNKVIALPDTTSLNSCSKDVLENINSMISDVIEKL